MTALHNIVLLLSWARMVHEQRCGYHDCVEHSVVFVEELTCL
jgi:hypothetical protein